MKQLFTVHAGEYLVGSCIEEYFKNFNVWIPSKDTGNAYKNNSRDLTKYLNNWTPILKALKST